MSAPRHVVPFILVTIFIDSIGFGLIMPVLPRLIMELGGRSIDSAAVFAGWLGAGYAVAQVGTAALGALAEKPELFGRVLVMVGLAEGIAIYGLIVSILILNRLG